MSVIAVFEEQMLSRLGELTNYTIDKIRLWIIQKIEMFTVYASQRYQKAWESDIIKSEF